MQYHVSAELCFKMNIVRGKTRLQRHIGDVHVNDKKRVNFIKRQIVDL
jgi:hypothetical protein